MIELKTVKLSEVEVSARFREEMGDIDGLADDISKKGIISPLAVMEQDGEKPYLLLAGGRRLLAIEKTGSTEVPVRVYPKGLTELEVRSIELSENLFRKDLTWLEKVNLQAEVHRLQQEIHGVIHTTPGRPVVSAHTQADTAKMLGVSTPDVAISVRLSKIANKFPELFEGVTKQSDAIKLVKKLGNQMLASEMSKKYDEETPRKGVLANKFILEDFFTGVRKVPDRSVDLVEIDPPYGIDLTEVKRGYDSKTESYNEIKQSEYISFIQRTMTECYRVMSDHSWLLCWFGPEPWFEPVFQAIIGVGLICKRIPGVWVKPSGQTNNPALLLASSTEHFFYARKGSPTLNKQGRSNAFNFSPVPPQKKIHPTERPIEMMEEIVTTFSRPGSTVMVPFLGSGNTLLAAHNSKMNAFGFELSKQYRDSFIVKLHTLGLL